MRLAKLQLFFLGIPQIKLNDIYVESDRRKAIALLSYLVLESMPQRREKLATLFWGDYNQSNALAYLRRTLWEINQMLGEDWIVANRDEITFLDTNVWIDVVEFQRTIKVLKQASEEVNVDNLIKVKKLYRGDFLEGFTLRDSPDFDTWQLFQAETIRQEYQFLLDELCNRLANEGRYAELIRTSRQWVQLDALNERAQRNLILAYAKNNQKSAALRQFRELEKLLEVELSTTPSPETVELLSQIQQRNLTVSSGFDNNQALNYIPKTELKSIPKIFEYADRFIGREREIKQISELIAKQDCRLLTLIGPGGIGKTRLATIILDELSNVFSDGVYYTTLTSIDHPDQLLSTISAAVGCVIRSEDISGNPLKPPTEQLWDYLSTKKSLLVVDNFEHVIAGAGFIAELINKTSNLKIIITSRTKLLLSEEWTFDVQGLELPINVDIGSALDSAAIRLFLDRAKKHKFDFTPNADNIASIHKICSLVNGSPLAIELSASWVRILSIDEIQDEISSNLDFLSSPLQNIPDRHKSMRAIFESSWNILEESEKEAFKKLSLFKGSFDRHAANDIFEISFINLSQLLDKSLIRFTDNSRYELHELLRQFAAEKLDQDSKVEIYKQQFCQYYLNLLYSQFEKLIGPDVKTALLTIEADYENVRSAWNFAVQRDSWSELYTASLSLIIYLQIRNKYQDGWYLFQQLSNRLLAGDLSDQNALKLKAVTKANLATFCQRLDFSKSPTGENCVELFQDAYQNLIPLDEADQHISALILNFGTYYLDPEISIKLMDKATQYFKCNNLQWAYGLSLLIRGDFAVYYDQDLSLAEKQYHTALEIFSHTKSPWFKGVSYKGLASIALMSGKYQLAKQFAEQSLAIYHDLGLSWQIVDDQLTLARAEVALGNYSKAIEYYLNNDTFLEKSGDMIFTAINYDCLGYAYYLSHDFQQAENWYNKSLKIYQQYGELHGLGMTYGNLGDIARAKNEYIKAVEYYSQGFNYLQKIDASWGMEVLSKKLGQILWISGNRSEAIDALMSALKLAVQMERDPEILEILVNLAPYFIEIESFEHATKILELAKNHHASPKNVAMDAEVILQNLKTKLEYENVNSYQLPLEAAFKTLALIDL